MLMKYLSDFFNLKKRLFCQMKLPYAKKKYAEKNSRTITCLACWKLKCLPALIWKHRDVEMLGPVPRGTLLTLSEFYLCWVKAGTWIHVHTFLCVSLSMSAAQIKCILVAFPLKKDQRGREVFDCLYCTWSVIFQILRPCTALQRLTTLFTFHITNLFFKFI